MAYPLRIPGPISKPAGGNSRPVLDPPGVLLPGPVDLKSIDRSRTSKIYLPDGTVMVWETNVDGDLTNPTNRDILLTAAAAPQSQTENGLIDQAGYILDGGHPNNRYPSSRNNDDAEFNNSSQADNNTIGSIAGGDYWEWLANNPAAGSGLVSINSVRSHLLVRVTRTDGDASLQANLSASVPAATIVTFTACLRFVRPFSTTSDEYFAIRLLDVSTSNYYEVSYRNNGSGAMSIRSDYVDGGARTQDGSTATLTEVPATIWLRWTQQSNTKYRAAISYDGLSWVSVQSAAYTFSNTYDPDRIILVFGQSDSAALSSIYYNVDSVRRGSSENSP